MPQGEFKNLNITPGINKNDTAYQSEAQFIDGDKIRFYRGTCQKIGGWQSVQVTQNVTGVPRAIHTWADLRGEREIAIGTNLQLALFRNGIDFQDITPEDFNGGLADNVLGFGWGAGPWGGDNPPLGNSGPEDFGWGEGPENNGSTIGVPTVKLQEWSLDNFGEDLIANPKGGNIYRWRRNMPGDPATLIQGSPRANLIAIAEPVPYLVAYGTQDLFGVFDPLLIRWSDQADFENFDPTSNDATGTAGDFRLQGASEIRGIQKTKRETLVFTDDPVFSQRQVAGVGIFAFERVGDNCGIISRNASEHVNDTVYWMGEESFYLYNGSVTPVASSLDDMLFDRTDPNSINFFQKEKVYAGVNPEFSEIVWFYPSRDSLECNRYVIYNYLEGTWYDGNLDRTTWTSNSLFDLPLATDASGVLYEHEFGQNADGLPLRAFITTGVFDNSDGNQLIFVDKFIPDFNDQVGDLTVTFTGKKYPMRNETILKGPFTITPSTDRIDFRIRARQLQFTIESNEIDGHFDFGVHRINLRPDGER